MLEKADAFDDAEMVGFEGDFVEDFGNDVCFEGCSVVSVDLTFHRAESNQEISSGNGLREIPLSDSLIGFSSVKC